MTIYKIKRAYEKPSPDDGYRVLVDRLWPRGLSKQTLHADLWLKEVAPSNELREWFGHDPAKFDGFKKKYKAELKSNPTLEEIRKIKESTITLIYGARDEVHNQAAVLKEFLENRR